MAIFTAKSGEKFACRLGFYHLNRPWRELRDAWRASASRLPTPTSPPLDIYLTDILTLFSFSSFLSSLPCISPPSFSLLPYSKFASSTHQRFPLPLSQTLPAQHPTTRQSRRKSGGVCTQPVLKYSMNTTVNTQSTKFVHVAIVRGARIRRRLER